MAAIYETLVYSDEVDRIDLAAYLGRFVDALCQGYVIERDFIHIETSIESRDLDAARAVSLGLVLNELVTNALKYAYQPGSRGEIRIEIAGRGEELELRVSDQGQGLPPGLDPAASTGMGFTLIRLLVQQLGGRLQIESGRGLGTCARVLMPK
jgi:two-component sensor histidine kinase